MNSETIDKYEKAVSCGLLGTDCSLFLPSCLDIVLHAENNALRLLHESASLGYDCDFIVTFEMPIFVHFGNFS